MSKRRNEGRSVSAIEGAVQNENGATKTRKSLWLCVGLVAMLLTVGVFAKQNWFPSTDALTGKRTGWFGKQNASSSWNPLAAVLPTSTPQLSKEYIYAGRASKVSEDVDLLTGRAAWFFGFSNDELVSFANEGNRTIFEDAFSKLAALKGGGPLSAQAAFEWDGLIMSQEQHLIQPSYQNMSEANGRLLEGSLKRNFWLSKAAQSNTGAFPQERSIFNVSHRWEFGMKFLGYEVSPSQMPNPGARYSTPEMYNRLNPGRPVGPVVVSLNF
jgi:hypothetical protein